MLIHVIYFVCDVTKCDLIEIIIFVSFSASNMLPTEGLPQSARGQYSPRAGCPLVRILTGKSGYLDDVLFLSGLSGYMAKKRSKNPKIRIFYILSFIVSGWCQDISEISIHPLLHLWYILIHLDRTYLTPPWVFNRASDLLVLFLQKKVEVCWLGLEDWNNHHVVSLVGAL